MSSPPLADVRVLSVEQFGAGPWGTLQLADLGADVIKVEDPASGGDVGAHVPPYQVGEDSLFFESFNRNKRSISLDLRSEAGREVLHDLVRSVDAVYSNLRGDQAARLGLTYESLGEVNPRIVCCSLSGFGNDRPAREAGGLRLHHPGARGLDEPDRRARRAADEVAGSRSSTSSAGYVVGARARRRRVAGSPRRRRLRLRHLAVRGGARAAHLRRHLGGEPRLRPAPPRGVGASFDRPLPGLRGRRRLVRDRMRQAEVLGAAVRRDRASRPARGRRATPTSRAVARTATCSSPSCARSSASRAWSTGSRRSRPPVCRSAP